jgi:hypothetical protein
VTDIAVGTAAAAVGTVAAAADTVDEEVGIAGKRSQLRSCVFLLGPLDKEKLCLVLHLHAL